jgi:hypothetical protein
VRHANGTYYLRVKVHGKVIRESLKVNDLRLAKIKREDRYPALRAASAAGKHGVVRTIRDVFDLLRSDIRDAHSLAAVKKLA